jgi:hypothetical protein
MEQGKEIGRRARNLYPEGIFVNELSSPAAAARTRELLDNSHTHVLFEATFLAGNYIAKADILVRDAGSWELIEVKSSVVTKEEFIDDMAFIFDLYGFSVLDNYPPLLFNDTGYGFPHLTWSELGIHKLFDETGLCIFLLNGSFFFKNGLKGMTQGPGYG